MKTSNLIGSILLILTLGTVGYHLIEGWSFFDGLYMTAITITTVGFGEIHPLSVPGRIFTLVLIFIGLAVASTFISHVAAAFLRGELQKLLGRRRMEKDLKRLSGHYILCGYGRMGKVIAKEFSKKGVPFVVIENSAAELSFLDTEGKFPYVNGNASDEITLRQAGVERAKGVITAVSTDADNAFITMTAKGLNPNIRIVARAADPNNIEKLTRAGATKVISPYIIGGTRLAQAILNPGLVDFMELAADQDSIDIEMADVEIHKGCPFEGITLDHPEIKALELIFVSVQRQNHKMLFKPDARTALSAGDRVIAVGKPEHIQKMISRAGA